MNVSKVPQVVQLVDEPKLLLECGLLRWLLAFKPSFQFSLYEEERMDLHWNSFLFASLFLSTLEVANKWGLLDNITNCAAVPVIVHWVPILRLP